jgi:hypothetical protein
MKKSDLKTGMWVEHRNKKRAVVLLNTNLDTMRPERNKNRDMLVTVDGGWHDLTGHREDLTCVFDSEYDIVKVFDANKHGDAISGKNLNLIWQREETIEMTIEEACKKLREVTGKPIKITI